MCFYLDFFQIFFYILKILEKLLVNLVKMHLIKIKLSLSIQTLHSQTMKNKTFFLSLYLDP